MGLESIAKKSFDDSVSAGSTLGQKCKNFVSFFIKRKSHFMSAVEMQIILSFTDNFSH